MWLLNYLSTYGLIMQLATAIRHLQYTQCYELLRERAIGRGTPAGLSLSPPLHHYSGVSPSIPQRIRSNQIREGWRSDPYQPRDRTPSGCRCRSWTPTKRHRGRSRKRQILRGLRWGWEGVVAGGGRCVGVRRGSRRTIGGWAGCGWVWDPIYLAFSS